MAGTPSNRICERSEGFTNGHISLPALTYRRVTWPSTLITVEYVQEYVDRGGERLGVQIYPEPDAPRAVLVVWPAMGVPARYYRRFAVELRRAGFAVVVADLRGTGASTPQPSRRSGYR